MRLRKWKKAFIYISLMCSSIAYAQYTEKDILNYIDTYHQLAIQKMKDYGIPASITLAQGILESAAGTSDLAREANNHFGIKCHSTWEGKSFYKDDDAKNECFRSYTSVEQSYDDHSAFLKRERYTSLFNLKITDYKSWAKELKKCGYATDPHYDNRLIDLIEKYELYAYDTDAYTKSTPLAHKGSSKGQTKPNEVDKNQSSSPTNQATSQTYDTRYRRVDYPYSKRTVYINNNVYFILARPGDTFYDIAIDVQLTVGQLRKYNDVPNLSYEPMEGEIVYISKKASKAEKTREHIVRRGESLRDIAQQYACREKALRKLNAMSKTDELQAGDRVKLR